MADNKEFKIKGAATARAEVTHPSSSPGEENASSAKPESSSPKPKPESKLELEEGEEVEELPEEIKGAGVAEQDEAKTEQDDNLQRYRWCKCLCDPLQYGRDHYYLNLDSQESRWDEPSEPYWIWDASKQALDEAGLQQPTTTSAPTTSDDPDPNYYGYDPRIHGSYDPNAPYAQYHKQKREQEASATQPASNMVQPGFDAVYDATATFNRFTGAFQTADKSVEQHDDHHKSGRQMGAFFDVDAAANAHGGRSLKEERRNQTLSKKQIKEMAAKRREKKEKKRMDFYKS